MSRSEGNRVDVNKEGIGETGTKGEIGVTPLVQRDGSANKEVEWEVLQVYSKILRGGGISKTREFLGRGRESVGMIAPGDRMGMRRDSDLLMRLGGDI